MAVPASFLASQRRMAIGLLPDLAKIERPSNATQRNASGNKAAPTPADVADNVPCRRDSIGQKAGPRGGRSSFSDRVADVADLIGVFPFGTDLQNGDTVTVGGDVYTVKVTDTKQSLSLYARCGLVSIG